MRAILLFIGHHYVRVRQHKHTYLTTNLNVCHSICICKYLVSQNYVLLDVPGFGLDVTTDDGLCVVAAHIRET